MSKSHIHVSPDGTLPTSARKISDSQPESHPKTAKCRRHSPPSLCNHDFAIALLKCLKAGISVIIDEGFWAKEHRDAISEKVKAVDAIPRLYYIEAPFEIMRARTLKRSENPPVDSYTIDEDAFTHYWKFFRPPGKDEEFELIDQASIDKEE